MNVSTKCKYKLHGINLRPMDYYMYNTIHMYVGSKM